MTIIDIDKDTLLLKTKKDVKTFMKTYKIDSCYEEKIKKIIEKSFGEILNKNITQESFPIAEAVASPRRISKILSPRSSIDFNSEDIHRKYSSTIVNSLEDNLEKASISYLVLEKLAGESFKAKMILDKMWFELLKIFNLESIKEHWSFYEWNDMTNKKNLENGLNMIFWIFRQIAVHFLLYLYSLLFPPNKLKMSAMGSVSVTSDYDISIISDRGADFTRVFNFFFLITIDKTSGILFDTNIYAHPIVELIEHKPKESNYCYNFHKIACKFLKVPNLKNDFLQSWDRISAILMYYKYFGKTLIKEVDLEYITYEFIKKNFSKCQEQAETEYKRLQFKDGEVTEQNRKFKDGEVTNKNHQDKMNEYYENIAKEIQDIKDGMNKMCENTGNKNSRFRNKLLLNPLTKELMNDKNDKITLLLKTMTKLQFFGNETLLSVSAFLHVVVYLQEMCTDHVFSGCRKTIINKSNAKFIYLNSFIENLCFMTTHFKDINEKGLKKIMKYLYRTCDALVECLKNVKKTPTQKLITIHKITEQWQQNKNKGEPEKMTENVEQLKEFIIETQTIDSLIYRYKDIKYKTKLQVTFLMGVFQEQALMGVFQEQAEKKTKVISGGKKKKVIRKNKKKKVRKHQGISQTGGNIGKLKKGFRYSGKKLKSGLPQIIKCKQTNKSKK